MKTQPLDVQPLVLMNSVNTNLELVFGAKTMKTIAHTIPDNTLKAAPNIWNAGRYFGPVMMAMANGKPRKPQYMRNVIYGCPEYRQKCTVMAVRRNNILSKQNRDAQSR
jgi:hypothetical protein